MQPFARWKRTLYLAVLAVLFFVVVPVAILYAAGYRYRGTLGVVHTGGIFVSVSYSGARVLLDGKEIGVSGLLKHDFYISDLTPGSYRVRVERTGDRTWERILVVEQNLVSTASALLIPDELRLVRLTTATSTDPAVRTISSAQRSTYLAAFTAPVATTSIGALDEQGGEALFLVDGDAFVQWTKTDAPHPSSFCGRPSYCTDEIPIEVSKGETTTRAAFYAGGVVYRTREGGVFITEADVREHAVSATLYSKPGSDFIIAGGALIVKDGSALYAVEGL